jgi:hypothetical protein
MTFTRQTRGRLRHSADRRIVALVFCLGMVWAPPAQAGLVISVPNNVPATAGSLSNFFDVSLTVTGTYKISAFQFTLDLPNGSGVTFTAADNSSPNYLFPDSSGLGATIDNGGLTIIAGDLELNPPGYVTLSDTTVSLGRVDFQVDLTAQTGTVPVSFDTSPNQTLVLDDLGSPWDYSTTSGSILVSASSVPEPSAFLLMGAGALLVLGYARYFRRRPSSRAGQAA